MLKEGKLGPPDVTFNTEMLGLLGREGKPLSESTSHRSHPGGPSERPDGCLSPAFLEAATRGQALTLHQHPRNHSGSSCPGAGASELSSQQPGRGLKREQAGERAWPLDLDLGSHFGSTTLVTLDKLLDFSRLYFLICKMVVMTPA